MEINYELLVYSIYYEKINIKNVVFNILSNVSPASADFIDQRK